MDVLLFAVNDAQLHNVISDLYTHMYMNFRCAHFAFAPRGARKPTCRFFPSTNVFRPDLSDKLPARHYPSFLSDTIDRSPT